MVSEALVLIGVFLVIALIVVLGTRADRRRRKDSSGADASSGDAGFPSGRHDHDGDGGDAGSDSGGGGDGGGGGD